MNLTLVYYLFVTLQKTREEYTKKPSDKLQKEVIIICFTFIELAVGMFSVLNVICVFYAKSLSSIGKHLYRVMDNICSF